jgi:CDP-diacylglycerol--glycerol-3-phosphate 3-phosphatidyltransferase
MDTSTQSQATALTLTERARKVFQRILNPITGVLMRTPITPNALTVMGAIVNALIGFIVATGNLTLGGIVLLVSGLFDSLDGALARRIGVTSKFGAFLDSTLDRYSEAFVLLGLLVYAGDRGLVLEQRLVFVTLVGSLLISYTRARAEGLGIDCKVGLLTRMERFLILSSMLIVQQVTLGLIVLAVLTHITVIQRISHVRRSLRRIERTSND